MKLIQLIIIFLLATVCLFSFPHCESGNQKSSKSTIEEDSVSAPFTGYIFKVQDRTGIFDQLSKKIKAKKTIVIHAFVPMCDNDHQGIVPVNNQLGDGWNLRTNLYWGAGYGVKSYFKKYGGWKLVHSEQDTSKIVIERAVFYKKTAGGNPVYFVADAYRGDHMKACLHDYFRSLSGWKTENDTITGVAIPLYSNADLLIFNGHDGLMDDTLKHYYSRDSIQRETVTIACYAKSFFNPRFEECGAYPLIGTSGLLAPEAYVMDAVIESWVSLKSAQEIRYAAGDAYFAKHPSSSQKGSRALFTTGW